jgi:hypothetical protein
VKSFIWFVVGALAAAIGALALSRTPRGKAVLAELDDSAGAFFDAMSAGFQERRSEERN